MQFYYSKFWINLMVTCYVLLVNCAESNEGNISEFFFISENKRLTDQSPNNLVFGDFSEIKCLLKCAEILRCFSVNWHFDSRTCEVLFVSNTKERMDALTDEISWMHYQKICKPLLVDKYDVEVYGGRCYYFSKETTNWANAENACIDLGGHLVSIHSAEEDKFVFRGLEKRAWHGLNDFKVHGTYVWTDETPTNFLRFDINEPTGYQQHCGCYFEVTKGYNYGGWHDCICNEVSTYVCKV